MEAPNKMVLPGELHPVRNSGRCDSKPSGALDPAGIIIECNLATGGTAEQRGNISNGVDITSLCALGSTIAGQSGVTVFLECCLPAEALP
jgi:hypothetical protein